MTEKKIKKILHLRFGSIKIEDCARENILPKIREKLPDDVMLIVSCVCKQGIGKRINEMEMEYVKL